MPKPSREGDLVRACLQLLTARGWLAWRQNAGVLVLPGPARRAVRMGPAGMPDILALRKCGPGSLSEVLAIETKRGDARVTPVQAAMHERLRKENVAVLIVRDIATLSAWLPLAPASPGPGGKA